jgi:hypothetical protein
MRYFTKARKRTLKSCDGHAFRISENEFRVKDYTVYKSRKGWLCECKHYVFKQTPCSHIVYVATHKPLPSMGVKVDDVTDGLDKVVLGESDKMNVIAFIVMVSMMSVSPLLVPTR